MVVGICMSLSANGQHDPHFSLFNDHVLNNPTWAADFDGRTQAAAVYREQWRKVMDRPFKTMAATANHKFRADEYETVAGGFSVLSDIGTGSVKQQMLHATVAYRRLLAKDRIRSWDQYWFYLNVGGSAGLRQLSIINGLTYANQFTGSGYNANLTSGEAMPSVQGVWAADLNAGLSVGAYTKAGHILRIGGSLHHLNTPTMSIYDRYVDGERLDMRLTLHQDLQWRINRNLFFTQSLLFHQQSALWQVLAGASIGWILDPEASRTFRIGGNLRIADQVNTTALWPPESAALFLQGKFGDYTLGLAYDFIQSALVQNARSGAFELHATYTIPLKRPTGCPSILF